MLPPSVRAIIPCRWIGAGIPLLRGFQMYAAFRKTGLMVLTGEGLHMAKLLLEDGKLQIEGRVDSLVYEQPRKSFRFSQWWKHGKK